MDDKEFNYINAIPGSGVQCMEVIGMAVASTSGFWFEFDKDHSDWVGVERASRYERHSRALWFDRTACDGDHGKFWA